MIKKNFSKLKKTFSEESTTSNQSPNPFEVEKQIKLISIFDWDDTLFCTKYFDTFNLNYSDIFSFKTSLQDSNPYLLNELKDLENSILNLFLELKENNFEIFIISNADKKWIDNCLIHFSISNSYFWKKKCFKTVLLDNFKDNNLEIKILSIGDSYDEKRATLDLRKIKFFYKLNVQFVKMIFCPSAASIIIQLKYIENNLKTILNKKSLLQKMIIEQNNKSIVINCIDDFEEEEIEDCDLSDDDKNSFNFDDVNSLKFKKRFLKKKRKMKKKK